MLKRLAKSFVVARTASILSQLSDQQLDDIGIARRDIYSYAESINA